MDSDSDVSQSDDDFQDDEPILKYRRVHIDLNAPNNKREGWTEGWMEEERERERKGERERERERERKGERGRERKGERE